MLAGALGALLCQYLWTDRQDKYVHNLVARYDNEYLIQHPDSLPYLFSYPCLRDDERGRPRRTSE